MKFVCCCFFFCVYSCVYGQESTFSQTYQELHKRIQTHIAQQQFEQGLRTNQKLYGLAQKEKEPIAESLYWQNMALLHQNRDIAFYYHWKSIKILQKVGKYEEAQNNWLAYQNYNYKTPKYTIDSLEKAFKTFEKTEEKPFMAELGKILTAQALQEGKLNDALFYQKKTLELYQHTQNVQGITSTLLNGVLIYEKQGRKDKTIEIELELLKFIERIESKEDLMICLHLVGYFYYRTQNRYALAIEYFLKASQISQETDEVLLKLQLFYIGLLYRNQEYHLKSSEYFEKVKDLTEKSPQTSLNQIPEVYNALGFSLSAKGNLAQARGYHIKATQIAEKTQDTLALAQALDGVGQVYLQLKAYKEALEHLKKALAYSKSLHNHILTSYICYYMAEAYKGLDKQEESLAYALEAYQMALQANWGATKIKASLLLADLYGLVGKHKEAYLFQKRHLAYRDSILSRDNANRLADIEVQIALQKTQQAIKLKDEENKNQRLWLGSLIGTLLAVIFLLVILYRHYRTQQKNNKKLAEQKQEIENQADTLAKVNNTKDTLFAIIGHDLRSPLNSLKGLMSLLENDNISPEEFILLSGKLKNGVEHVHFTLNNLLLWANSQMQGLETRPTQVNLTTLVKENFNLFGEIAKNKKIDLHHNLPTEINAWADADQINLVLRNLISNALKFTPKGGEVKVRAMQKEQHIEIHLQDSGVGISAETLGNLFRQDKHISTHGTQGEKGTGLGLLLCQEMINKNGGKIWVESELEVGTTFKFTLPTL